MINARGTIIGAVGDTSPLLALAVGGAACGAAAITGIAIRARAHAHLIPHPAAENVDWTFAGQNRGATCWCTMTTMHDSCSAIP